MEILDKEVDLGEPTSFLDHVHMGGTKRQCDMSKDIVDNFALDRNDRKSMNTTQVSKVKLSVDSDTVIAEPLTYQA